MSRPRADAKDGSPLGRTVMFAGSLGVAGIRTALVPASAAVAVGRAVERRTRRVVVDVAGQAGLGA
ncbi:MAG: hypothetical protein ACXVHD_28555, partial [Solirubrobacteraceae bacterium]